MNCAKEYLMKNQKKTIINIIDNVKKQGCEGVVLGCSELGLLIKQEDIDTKIFDTTVIHAKNAAELALK